ncbi:MAG TPA: mammalian cell entry protein [Mycobacterium sp.]|nr:mammalian cell entry protein [Mycobacterium sp.]
MTEPPGSATDETRPPTRRRASRAAGPASPDATAAEAMTMTVPVDGTTATASRSEAPGPPPRRQPRRSGVAVIAAVSAAVLLALLGGAAGILVHTQGEADATARRQQQFVDTGAQTVVNMFSYTPDTIDQSVNRFMDGISGPLRDMMSQNNNAENLKAMFRDTNASSEAVVNGAALEAIDEDRGNGSVLVAVRVTVTDVDGVNKPSQAYRLRVIVHEDDNGRMTGYDLKYPEGGN